MTCASNDNILYYMLYTMQMNDQIAIRRWYNVFSNHIALSLSRYIVFFICKLVDQTASMQL